MICVPETVGGGRPREPIVRRPLLMSAEDLADACRAPIWTVLSLCRNREVHHVKIGYSTVMFPVAHVDVLLDMLARKENEEKCLCCQHGGCSMKCWTRVERYNAQKAETWARELARRERRERYAQAVECHMLNAKPSRVKSEAVYFIRVADGGPIKIGKAKHLPSRLSALGAGFPGEPEVLMTISGYSEEETWLHRRFKHLRVKGEWFAPDCELIHWMRDVVSRGGARKKIEAAAKWGCGCE